MINFVQATRQAYPGRYLHRPGSGETCWIPPRLGRSIGHLPSAPDGPPAPARAAPRPITSPPWGGAPDHRPGLPADAGRPGTGWPGWVRGGGFLRFFQTVIIRVRTTRTNHFPPSWSKANAGDSQLILTHSSSLSEYARNNTATLQGHINYPK